VLSLGLRVGALEKGADGMRRKTVLIKIETLLTSDGEEVKVNKTKWIMAVKRQKRSSVATRGTARLSNFVTTASTTCPLICLIRTAPDQARTLAWSVAIVQSGGEGTQTMKPTRK
jgi:hypothetical protein